jgi:hypothetical protein
MTHWGWYWKIKKKHIPRIVCSELPSIDSFKLYKNNMIAGFSVQPWAIRAAPTADHLKVTYRNRKAYSYLISIEKQACNYGGFRYFFKCPLCHKRMRILYFAEQSVFLCRKCLNLSYLSQRLRPTERYRYMSNKIKEHIKNKGGTLDNNQKPSYMHKDKYQKLKSKQLYYESKSHQALIKELREWYGARIEPYLDNPCDYADEK